VNVKSTFLVRVLQHFDLASRAFQSFKATPNGKMSATMQLEGCSLSLAPLTNQADNTVANGHRSQVVAIASPRVKTHASSNSQQTKTSQNSKGRRRAGKRADKPVHDVHLINECVVRVDDRADQLAREIRVQSVQLLSVDTYVDSCLVWLQHVLFAEQLLLLTSFHGMHEMHWHIGPSLRSDFMLQDSRYGILYWQLGVICMSGLLFVVPAAIYVSLYFSVGQGATFHIFSHRSGLFTVSLLCNPGVVISSILLVVFNLKCCSEFKTSDTRLFLVVLPVTCAIGFYFAWGVFEVFRVKKGYDMEFLRYKTFALDTQSLLYVKASLFVLTEIFVILKMEKVHDMTWIRVISPLLAMLGIMLAQSAVRSAWIPRCCDIDIGIYRELDRIAAIDSLCIATFAVLVAYKLDHPSWTHWSGAIAVPIVSLFVLHSLFLILDFFRRLYSPSTLQHPPITWLEPILVGLDMDEDLQHFEVCTLVLRSAISVVLANTQS
jgi:hypothetical protein